MPLPDWMNASAAHPLPPLRGARLHVLGAGGRGVAPFAAAAIHLGADVDGCDPVGYPYVMRALERRGMAVERQHDPAHLDDGRRLVATSAARIDNPEVVRARSQGVLHRRMDLVAAVLRDRPGIGVTGSHGKGTVAAFAAAALIEAGLDPLVCLGVECRDLGGDFRAGDGPTVAEVDDSDLAAEFVEPQVGVVTNLDHDHPHLPTTLAEAITSVAGFAANARDALVLGPSPRAREFERAAKAPVFRYGRDFGARVIRRSPEGSTVRLWGPDGSRETADVRLIGVATAANTALAFAAAVLSGADPGAAAAGLARIRRLYRRLEPTDTRAGVRVYDDFGGKHPANVAEGLRALAALHDGATITAIFEPVFARTVNVWGWRYANALRQAHRVIVLPTVEHVDYPATGGERRPMVDRVPGAVRADSLEEAAELAVHGARPGDVVVAFTQLRSGVELRDALVTRLGGAAHAADA